MYQTPPVERTAVAGSSLANQLINVPQGVCSQYHLLQLKEAGHKQRKSSVAVIEGTGGHCNIHHSFALEAYKLFPY